jgi:hypothetical protein
MSTKKINEGISKVVDIIDQRDLANIYRVFHPTITQYIFFSAAHRTFSKIDHILGCKESLNKFKKIDIILIFYLVTME